MSRFCSAVCVGHVVFIIAQSETQEIAGLQRRLRHLSNKSNQVIRDF